MREAEVLLDKRPDDEVLVDPLLQHVLCRHTQPDELLDEVLALRHEVGWEG